MSHSKNKEFEKSSTKNCQENHVQDRSRNSTKATHNKNETHLILGIDMGTTAVKVCISSSPDSPLAESSSTHKAYLPNEDLKEQDAIKLLQALHHCLWELPQTLVHQITHISVCGQMHGIMWWKCAPVVTLVLEHLEKLSTQPNSSSNNKQQHHMQKNNHINNNNNNNNNKTLSCVSHLVTWEDQRCSEEFLDTLPKSSRIHTGYGLGTYRFLLDHSPNVVEHYDACGTIQDFLVFLLCEFSNSKETTIDTTDANSWGCFNLKYLNWDKESLEKCNLPYDILPTIKIPGTLVGKTGSKISSYFGIPTGVKVGVAMGDHPCLMASLPRGISSCAMLNIGTSAQLAILLPKDKLPLEIEHSPVFEYRPYLKDQIIAVAAYLSGGNVIAQLVEFMKTWLSSFGASIDEDKIYEIMIQKGKLRKDTQLKVSPTFWGERYNRNLQGEIKNIEVNNMEIGDLMAAFSKGIISNIFSHPTMEFLQSLGIQKIYCSGNAIHKNELLQYYIPEISQMQVDFDTHCNACFGATLVISL